MPGLILYFPQYLRSAIVRFPLSLWRHQALRVEDGTFSHKNWLEDSKSQRISKLHNWLKIYSNFDEWVDYAYWWIFNGGGFEINRATLSSLIRKEAKFSLLVEVGKRKIITFFLILT